MNLKKLFIASKNKGKIEEIKAFLAGFNYEVFSLIDTPNISDIPETGNSFEENALIKARAVFDIVKIPVLSDDSGLEVDFLNGAPGIYSARFSGSSANDKSNNQKLLRELYGAENRTARFKCVICLFDGSSERFFEGVCEGKIGMEPRGNDGFGYDPLFVPDGYDMTFAELGLDVKNEISHRGKALKSLRKFLELEELM